MTKLLIICGPTATGKTALGVHLAKKFDGEIVSADSRQVYKGMDIGTGKDLPLNSKLKTQNSKLQLKTKNYKIGYHLVDSIPVWLLDIVTPDYKFSVADYVRCASLVVKDIWSRDKLPILVGGTGFYIKAAIDGIETIGVPPDWRLRKQLNNLTIKQLREKLKKLDPKRWKGMNENDRNNPRRLIRAIEIATSEMEGPPRLTRGDTLGVRPEETLFIGLTAPNEVLYQRIDKRVDERVKQGMEREIRRLLDKGYSWETSVLGETIGYQEWRIYIKNSKLKTQNSKLRDKIIQRWKFDEHSYVRRQMTWFKKDKRIYWFDITKKGWENKIEKKVFSWYTKNNAEED